VRLCDSPMFFQHECDKPFLSYGNPQNSIYAGVHSGCTIPSWNIRAAELLFCPSPHDVDLPTTTTSLYESFVRRATGIACRVIVNNECNLEKLRPIRNNTNRISFFRAVNPQTPEWCQHSSCLLYPSRMWDSYGSEHAISRCFQRFSPRESYCPTLAHHFRWQNHPQINMNWMSII
jgi:hypothetical protein